MGACETPLQAHRWGRQQKDILRRAEELSLPSPREGLMATLAALASPPCWLLTAFPPPSGWGPWAPGRGLRQSHSYQQTWHSLCLSKLSFGYKSEKLTSDLYKKREWCDRDKNVARLSGFSAELRILSCSVSQPCYLRGIPSTLPSGLLQTSLPPLLISFQESPDRPCLLPVPDLTPPAEANQGWLSHPIRRGRQRQPHLKHTEWLWRF